VTVEPTPAPFIGEMKDAAVFYANRVKKEYKDIDRKHVEWADSFLTVLVQLQSYVRSYHTTGLTWNPNGAEASFVSKGSIDKSALFSSLNKGEGITAGLKKVDRLAEKTKGGYGVGVVPVRTVPLKGAGTPTGPPKTQLMGNKWVVENHVTGEVVLDKAEKEQGIYIYNCGEVAISVKGKVNVITMDKCTRTGLIVTSVVSNLEVIGCKNVQLQVLQTAPTVTVENTDGMQLFLSESAKDLDLFTCKSNSVNVLLEEQGQPGEFAENPVPEQLVTKVVNNKLVTTAVMTK